MHTVELLEEATELARSLGYQVRQEWLDGGGGACELKGRKWLFVDLSLSSFEQLEQVLSVIRSNADWQSVAASSELRRRISPRKAA